MQATVEIPCLGPVGVTGFTQTVGFDISKTSILRLVNTNHALLLAQPSKSSSDSTINIQLLHNQPNEPQSLQTYTIRPFPPQQAINQPTRHVRARPN